MLLQSCDCRSLVALKAKYILDNLLHLPLFLFPEGWICLQLSPQNGSRLGQREQNLNI